MKKSSKKYFGFTLVELIIVITILAILATIAFVSFQGYTKKSQDSVRLESLSSISKGLEVFEAVNSKFPLPDNKIDIKSGTEIISYQGVAGDSVLNIINSSKAQDPLDKTYFTYSVDKIQKKYSLLTYLQNQLSYNSIEVLADYSNRFPYVTGNKVGVLLDNSNNPIQETLTGSLDLSTSTNNYKVYFSNDTTSGIFTLSGSSLANKIVAVISNTSCSGTTYTGTYANYNILPLTNNTTYTFSYNSGSVANGNFSSSVQVTCKDGNLSYVNEQKTLNCNTGYYSSGNTTCESQWYSSGGVYTFKNTSGNITYPTTCNDLLNTNSFKVGSLNYTGTGFLSGKYYISKNQTTPIETYCDMALNGGGRTRYVNIKGNYSLDDALSCYNGNIIENSYLSCFSPIYANPTQLLLKASGTSRIWTIALGGENFDSLRVTANPDRSYFDKMTAVSGTGVAVRLGRDYKSYRRSYGGSFHDQIYPGYNYMNYNQTGSTTFGPGYSTGIGRELNALSGEIYFK